MASIYTSNGNESVGDINNAFVGDRGNECIGTGDAADGEESIGGEAGGNGSIGGGGDSSGGGGGGVGGGGGGGGGGGCGGGGGRWWSVAIGYMKIIAAWE